MLASGAPKKTALFSEITQGDFHVWRPKKNMIGVLPKNITAKGTDRADVPIKKSNNIDSTDILLSLCDCIIRP